VGYRRKIYIWLGYHSFFFSVVLGFELHVGEHDVGLPLVFCRSFPWSLVLDLPCSEDSGQHYFLLEQSKVDLARKKRRAMETGRRH
jgi:hypothetical protein